MDNELVENQFNKLVENMKDMHDELKDIINYKFDPFAIAAEEEVKDIIILLYEIRNASIKLSLMSDFLNGAKKFDV